ncbi:MAG: terpene cyclase/mutase family protein [Chitinophagales bacterium]|nr:terpene cyclase/mutase family protein [Chitinophagales bacterium]
MMQTSTKTTFTAEEIFSFWRLHTENGRQTWHFQLPTEYANINWTSPEGKQILHEIDAAFCFNKHPNPNVQDAVFRNSFTKNSNTTSKANTPTEALQNGWAYFTQLLSNEGHFAGDYGGPLFLLPGYVIVHYITQTKIEEPYQTLIARYMLNHQNQDGSWGLHIEDSGTMFGTCLHYVSLRLLGFKKTNTQLQKAQQWILQHGGALTLPPWGKFYLSCLGIFEWEGNHSLLPELWLLPKTLPIHPSRYWSHARMVYLPMSYCFGNKLKAAPTPLLHELKTEIYTQPYQEINWKNARNQCCPKDVYHPPHKALSTLNFFTSIYEKIAVKAWRNKALNYAINYIDAEDQQTNYINIGPVNKMLNMLCIWHCYGKNSVQFLSHIKRLQDYLWLSEDGVKMQGYNGSQFWDTMFAYCALKAWKNGTHLREAESKMLDFISAQQIQAEPHLHQDFFRHPSVGGFPFSTKSHGWPITDCSAEGLKILVQNRQQIANAQQRCEQAATLLLSFQNKDGGWASYEKQRAPSWIETLNPSQIFGNIMVDYSYTECSSSAVQALITFQQAFPNFQSENIKTAITNGLNFICKQQLQDGSWYGSWAVCYTYGTWFGVEALYLAKEKGYLQSNTINTALQKAAQFLASKQNTDGGWGESFESCIQKKYTPSLQSQVVNTAWAVLALLKIGGFENEIRKGIAFITDKQLTNGNWEQENINGVFNHNCAISYTNFRNIFPLWALGEYEATQPFC